MATVASTVASPSLDWGFVQKPCKIMAKPSGIIAGGVQTMALKVQGYHGARSPATLVLKQENCISERMGHELTVSAD